MNQIFVLVHTLHHPISTWVPMLSLTVNMATWVSCYIEFIVYVKVLRLLYIILNTTVRDKFGIRERGERVVISPTHDYLPKLSPLLSLFICVYAGEILIDLSFGSCDCTEATRVLQVFLSIDWLYWGHALNIRLFRLIVFIITINCFFVHLKPTRANFFVFARHGTHMLEACLIIELRNLHLVVRARLLRSYGRVRWLKFSLHLIFEVRRLATTEFILSILGLLFNLSEHNVRSLLLKEPYVFFRNTVLL